MKAILSLLLAALACSASADVLIYKLKLSHTETGGGYSFKYSNAGYVVLDPDTGETWRLVTSPKAKTYYFVEFEDLQIDELEGPLGKEYNVATHNEEWLDVNDVNHVEHATIKGAKVHNVNVGATSLYYVPKSFTWIGREFGSYTTGETYLDEISGSLSLDVKSSTTSNLAGDDVFDALYRLESLLIAQGYIEED